MKKGTIELVLAKDERMLVAAYISDEPPGLAVHRAVEWVPAKSEHKHISKWTVTHVPTGLSLLGRSGYMDTKKMCVDFLKMVTSIDWVNTSEEMLRVDGRKIVDDALHAAKNGSVNNGTSEDEKPEEPRYIVRRAHGVGYEVVDTEIDAPVASFTHRGLASQKAKELRGKVST